MTSAETPAERVLSNIEYRLRITRDRFERELLRSLLLSAGITTLRNSKDKTLAIRENK